MALLDEKRLRIAQEKRAKFRLLHVGTKLSEEEHRALEELLAKRNQRQAELIRALILAEIEREKRGIQPSYEQTEITACRLMLVNLLGPIVTGKYTSLETFDKILNEVGKRKRRAHSTSKRTSVDFNGPELLEVESAFWQEQFCRGFPSQRLSWSCIEHLGNAVQFLLAIAAEVFALGQILPEQAVGVLVAAALPW